MKSVLRSRIAVKPATAKNNTHICWRKGSSTPKPAATRAAKANRLRSDDLRAEFHRMSPISDSNARTPNPRCINSAVCRLLALIHVRAARFGFGQQSIFAATEWLTETSGRPDRADFRRARHGTERDSAGRQAMRRARRSRKRALEKLLLLRSESIARCSAERRSPEMPWHGQRNRSAAPRLFISLRRRYFPCV